MISTQEIRQAHDESAINYDRLAHDYHWYPEILFGLCFEYTQPGERLLALGIGTGLCALPFAKAGLKVFGLDASSEMLKVCRSKGFAADLKQFDICTRPWPYPDGYFDHVIAHGMLHFLDDLDPAFKEVARVVKTSGLFSFTTKSPRSGIHSGKYSTEVISGVTIFLHHKAYLEALISDCGFEHLKDLEFMAGVDQSERCDPYLALITRKSETWRKDNETSR